MTCRLKRRLVAGVLLGLQGCATEVKQGAPMAGVSGAYDRPQTWLQAARNHEQEGDLHRALSEYRLANTVSHGSPIAQSELRRIEQQIAIRTTDLQKLAEQAERQRKYSRARSLYLDLLGLQPDHQAALTALRELDRRQSIQSGERRQSLAKKRLTGRRTESMESDYGDEGFNYSRRAILEQAEESGDVSHLLDELGRHLERYPNDGQLRQELVAATISRAEKAHQNREWEAALNYLSRAERICGNAETLKPYIVKTRKRIARELYTQGVMRYRSQPEQALSFWRYALKFDPADEKSRLRIEGMRR